MKIIKIFAWVIGFSILVIFIILQFNFYPVALTSKWIITSRQFSKIIESSLVYYQKIFSVYTTSTPITDTKFQQEIKRATLDKLIEDKIIDEVLLKKLGSEELKKMVDQKLANLSVNDKIADASQTLYNLSLKDFKNLVLLPEAKREILTEQGIDLQEIKKSYQPIILIPGLYWQNEVLIQEEN
jgi:predicted flavoprotein YhiN